MVTLVAIDITDSSATIDVHSIGVYATTATSVVSPFRDTGRLPSRLFAFGMGFYSAIS